MKILGWTLRVLSYLIGFHLILVPIWIMRTFGYVSFHQLIFHLSFGISGLLETDPSLMKIFLWQCVFASLVLTALVVATERSKKFRGRRFRLEIWLPLFGVLFFGYKLQVPKWIEQTRSNYDYYLLNYVSPKAIRDPRLKPKNLVLIYVESLEFTYSEPALFGRNLLAPLSGAEARGAHFTNYFQLPGTGTTTAGIVATQCGIPVWRLLLFDKNRQGEVLNGFLSKAVCLGDLLFQNGYQNVFMGGASLNFSGKGRFFKAHHYDEVWGRDEFVQAGVPGDRLEGWGLHDDDLFARAKEKLVELNSRTQPFNLTLLTVDMHHPSGYRTRSCVKKGAIEFADIVECSMTELAGFLDFIKERGWLETTNVVVLGDHLAMPNDVYGRILKMPTRSIYNLFLAKKKLKLLDRSIVHFDILPTLVESLGLKVPGGRAGLGLSGINEKTPQRTPKELQLMMDLLFNRSPTYEKLWGL